MFKIRYEDGTSEPFTKAKAVEIVESTDKPIKYTFGLGYRGPSTYKEPRTKEEALEIIKREFLIDMDVYKDYIHLNAYSDNDMW